MMMDGQSEIHESPLRSTRFSRLSLDDADDSFTHRRSPFLDECEPENGEIHQGSSPHDYPHPLEEESGEDAGLEDESNLSFFQAVLSVIKCAVGAGSFTLPRVFIDAGIFLAIPLTILVGYICCYTLILLLRIDAKLTESKLHHQHSYQSVSADNSCNANDGVGEVMHDDAGVSRNQMEQNNNSNNNKNNSSTSSTVAQLTLPELGKLTYPELTVTLYGTTFNPLSLLIFFSIIITTIGVCAAYIDFITTTIPEIVQGWVPNSSSSGSSSSSSSGSSSSNNDTSAITSIINKHTIPFIISPVLILLSFLKDFKAMVITSILGDISILLGFATVIIYGMVHFNGLLNIDNNDNVNSTNSSTSNTSTTEIQYTYVDGNDYNDYRYLFNDNSTSIPMFLGNSTFLFAIHAVIFPIIQRTKLTHKNNENSDINNSNNNNNRNISVDSKINAIKAKLVLEERMAFLCYSILIVINIVIGVIGALLYKNALCYENAPEYSSYIINNSTISNADAISLAVGPCANVLNNIQSGGTLDLIKVFVCIDLLMSIPLVLAVGREMISNGVNQLVASHPVQLPVRTSTKQPDDRDNNNSSSPVIVNSNNNSSSNTNRSSRMDASTAPTGNPLHNTTTAIGNNSTISSSKSSGDNRNSNSRNRDDRNNTHQVFMSHHKDDDDVEEGLETIELFTISSNEDASPTSNNNTNKSNNSCNNNNSGLFNRLLGHIYSIIQPALQPAYYILQSNSNNTLDEHDIHHSNSNNSNNSTVALFVSRIKKVVGNCFSRCCPNRMTACLSAVSSHSYDTVLRIVLVVLAIVIAVSIPQFNKLIALVGGVICSLTGFILPPLLYLKIHNCIHFDDSGTLNSNSSSSSGSAWVAAHSIRLMYICISLFGVLVAVSAVWICL